MIEEELKKIWKQNYEGITLFDSNAKVHYNMSTKSSRLFDVFRKEVQETYQAISSNLALALTSNILYIRKFGELVLKESSG